jgi:hypothetical protein
MAVLIVNRTSEYLNRWRDFGVYIDGKKVGTIANGETKEFNVSSGHHTIFTKIDWCGSETQSFSLDDTEIKAFKVGGFKHGHWLLPTALVITGLSYIARFLFEFEYLFYLVILLFLLLAYYMTVGRSKYLTLTEDQAKRSRTTAL